MSDKESEIKDILYRAMKLGVKGERELFRGWIEKAMELGVSKSVALSQISEGLKANFDNKEANRLLQRMREYLD